MRWGGSRPTRNMRRRRLDRSNQGYHMKSFNEWLKDKKLEEGIADYTPGFIRKPLQNLGLMGRTTEEEEAAERRRYLRSPQYAAMKKAEEEDEKKELEMMRKKAREDRHARGMEEIRKKREEEALERKKKEDRGLIYDYKTGEWRLPVVGKREREDWPYGG